MCCERHDVVAAPALGSSHTKLSPGRMSPTGPARLGDFMGLSDSESEFETVLRSRTIFSEMIEAIRAGTGMSSPLKAGRAHV
jgi:hypothetical protein